MSCNLFSGGLEVRFASFLSGGFTTGAVINPPERKLAKRTSVHCTEKNLLFLAELATLTVLTVV